MTLKYAGGRWTSDTQKLGAKTGFSTEKVRKGGLGGWGKR